MSEKCEARCAENIYDAITPDAQSFRSGNISSSKPTENGAHNMDKSHCGVTDNTYEGLNRNKSVNRTYDTLQNDQVQEQKIRKNPKKTYLIVGTICFLIGSVLAGSVVFAVMKYVSSSSGRQPEQLIQGSNMFDKSEKGGQKQTAENIYDAITPELNSCNSGNTSSTRPIENRTYDTPHCGVTEDTYEGLNPNKSVNRIYDCLQHDKHDQDRKQLIRKNHKKKYLIVVGIVCLLIGSALAGSVVFVVMKYVSSTSVIHPERLTQDCIWTTWSAWTGCTVTCGNGIQYRISQQVGATDQCKANTTNIDSKTCFTKTCPGDEMKWDLKLDRSTLHSTKYMSDDGVILSNHYSVQTPISGAQELNRDDSYKGASGNIYLKNNDVIYYEVSFEYTLRKVLASTNLILEIGLAPRDLLLNHEFVGNVKNAWSLAIARCRDSDNICIRAKHNGNLKVNKIFSTNRSGKTVKGNFEVMIDMESHRFCLTQNRAKIYTFESIPSSLKLYPVFAAYDNSKADVQLNISNAMNLTNFPNKNIFRCHL